MSQKVLFKCSPYNLIKTKTNLARRKVKAERGTTKKGPNRRNVQPAHIARRLRIWRNVVSGGQTQCAETANSLGMLPKFANIKIKVLNLSKHKLLM